MCQDNNYRPPPPPPPPHNTCRKSGEYCSRSSDCCGSTSTCVNVLGGSGKICQDNNYRPSPPPPTPSADCALDTCHPGTYQPCCSDVFECSAKSTNEYPNDSSYNINRCHRMSCSSDAHCPGRSTCQWGAWDGPFSGDYLACAY